MKRIASVLATATALTFVSIAPASAWGVEGHGIVGDVAAARLSPTASAEVAKLLQGEPNPTLAGVASWADEYRSTPDGAATAPGISSISRRTTASTRPRSTAPVVPM